MRVMQLLHRISLRCFPRQLSAALPLRAGSEEKAPDQKQSHRKQLCQNVYKDKGRRNIWHTPSRATGLVKDLTSQPFRCRQRELQKCSRRVCREGPRARIDSDASSLLSAVAEHLLSLQDHLVQLLQARLQALTVQSRAALRVAHGGRAELVKIQHLLHLSKNTEKRESQSQPNTVDHVIQTLQLRLWEFTLHTLHLVQSRATIQLGFLEQPLSPMQEEVRSHPTGGS